MAASGMLFEAEDTELGVTKMRNGLRNAEQRVTCCHAHQCQFDGDREENKSKAER